MNIKTCTMIGILGAAMLAASASAQVYEIPWYTIDGGGGTSTGGSFSLSGTIGQHDAGGPMSGGAFALTGGFWAAAGDACFADFNHDSAVDTRDVLAFLNAWTQQQGAADCDGNGVIDTRDVLCFLNLWTAGC
ncbi:MAG: hypothetical protein IPJ41_00375 [Phycisphaerales bacterium]|nr:hypothetical protein [Phycisphaerales bacterium]